MYKKSLFTLLLLFLAAQTPLVQAGLGSSFEKAIGGKATSAQSTKPEIEIADFPSWPDLSPDKAVAAQKKAAKKLKSQITKIAELPEEDMNFDSVYREFDRVMSEYLDETNYFSFIHLVRELESWDEANEDITTSAMEIEAWIGENQELKNAFLTVGQKVDTEDLDNNKSYFIYTSILKLEESGIDLNAKDKAKLDKLTSEMYDAEGEYDDNIYAATDECYVLVNKNEKALLEGIDEDLIEAAQELALEEGLGSKKKPAWLFLADPLILVEAEQEEMRERTWREINKIATEAPYDNAPVLDKILSTRDELAQLLGYKSFAALEADKTMIADSDTAAELLDMITQLAAPQYEAFMDELLAYINKKTGSKSKSINPWDINYYNLKREIEQHDFDEYEFCQYYPYEHVRDYCFRYFGDLFGLRIEETPSQYIPLGSGKKTQAGAISVWDPRVQVYSVFDQESGDYMGSFYLDAFERDGKTEGAWALCVKNNPKIEALVLDIQASEEGEPDIVAGTDIHTLVHELGHVLHFIMSETELNSQASDCTNVDFSETPSQLLEQWVLDRDFLKKMSKHIQTGKSIPDTLLDSYIVTRDSYSIIADIFHLKEVKLDLEMHRNYRSKFKGKDLNEASQEVLKDLNIKTSVPDSSPAYQLSSGISDGYRAKYYAYIWSNILVSDIFSVFQEKGLSNQKVGKELREKVYSKGASLPPVYLIEDFLGREIDPAPYFKHKGYIE